MAKPKVMVVDDEPHLVELLKAILEAEHMEVITAHGGQEALDRLEDVKPDLIILDIMMPVMSGFDVCEQIRSDPRTAKLKVVFLTALKLSAVDRSYLRTLKTLAYIVKPFDNKELVKEIKKCLKS